MQVVGTATLLAVDSAQVQVGVTLAANHLVTAVLRGHLVEGGLDDATLRSKHQLRGGLFPNAIV